jgi:hypothetical protein
MERQPKPPLHEFRAQSVEVRLAAIEPHVLAMTDSAHGSTSIQSWSRVVRIARMPSMAGLSDFPMMPVASPHVLGACYRFKVRRIDAVFVKAKVVDI